MKYKSEIQKFVTSQHIFSGVRIALAIVVPAIILAYYGLLQDFFLFPLGTSLVGLTDMVGPFHRRRNVLILAIVFFVLVATVTTLAQGIVWLIIPLILFFGVFFSIIGVYGIRLAAVGGLALVVFSLFIEGHLSGEHPLRSLVVFAAGCLWFLVVFMILMKLQPYKLAGQLIGENYLQLSDYLRLKSEFYLKNPLYDNLYKQVIAKQVVIKNLQEETREVVLKTRTIVNESTTHSRMLMLMFLNALDVYEKLMTSEQDYHKMHRRFGDSGILNKIYDYLGLLAKEIENIGIALQSGTKPKPLQDFSTIYVDLYATYSEMRNNRLNPDNLEDFMSMRMVLLRISELSEDVKAIYRIAAQDLKNMKTLSTGLDYEKFLPRQEHLNFKVLRNNLSVKSGMFRYSVRITIALLLGYLFSLFPALGIGHSYWILITIVAIMRPAYSTTKHRNMLRLYGTLSGAVVAYLVLISIDHKGILLGILLVSMILCFSFLKERYASAVFFMTIYIFIAFNFLNPGNVNMIFKDRIMDTFIAAGIVFSVSYFVLPVWEHTQNIGLMKQALQHNKEYFKMVIYKFLKQENDEYQYRMKRKDAIIALANLSDNFQRMLSDPKNQQKKMQVVHQYVTTTHLITAYIAALSGYSNSENTFSEIDFSRWEQKIVFEMDCIYALLNQGETIEAIACFSVLEIPEDKVDELLVKRKQEVGEREFLNQKIPNGISKLAELKNIREVLELLYGVVHEQYRIVQDYMKYTQGKKSA